MPGLYGANRGEKPAPGRIGHDEPGNAGPDKSDHVPVVGLESHDDHRRVPGRFPHLSQGILGLRRDGEDLEPGLGADQGVDAVGGGRVIIEQNQRDAGDHPPLLAVRGGLDNPAEGPLWTPL